MGKKLTAAELKDQMSIAGSPEKIIGIMNKMIDAAREVDITNAAELINLDMAIKWVHAEAKLWMRMYENRTKQKIR